MHQHHTFYCSDCTTSSTDLVNLPQKVRRLAIAFLLIAGLAASEFWVGHLSHSLALQAESGHMIADCGAIALALLAAWIAQWPTSERATFGYRRVEILTALANGLGLLVVAGLIAWEALEQLHSPPTEILSLPVLITAGIGLGINSLNAVLLHEHSHTDLNLRGAFLHMVADAVSAVGVILAAIAVWAFHWIWADGVMSLLVSGLITIGSIPLIRDSLNVLLERTPAHLDGEMVQSYLEGFEDVDRVAALRLWAVAPGQTALTACLEVTIHHGLKRDRLLHQLHAALQAEFNLQEITLQMTTSPTALIPTLSRTEIVEFVQNRVDVEL